MTMALTDQLAKILNLPEYCISADLRLSATKLPVLRTTQHVKLGSAERVRCVWSLERVEPVPFDFSTYIEQLRKVGTSVKAKVDKECALLQRQINYRKSAAVYAMLYPKPAFILEAVSQFEIPQLK